jgi:DNA repair protein RecO (recombination protein O)
MAFCKTEAIALRKVDYSNTSQIVTFYTLDHGKLNVLAKGSKRQTKKALDALDILTHYEIVFARKASGSLHTLTEWTVKNAFAGLSGELARMYAGMYVAELVSELTEEAEPSPELFALTLAALRSIAAKPNATCDVFALELKALRIVGYMPELTRCAGCGGSVVGHRRVGFSPRLGGVICDHCRGQEGAVVAISGGSLAAMASLAQADATRVDRLRLFPQTVAEIRGTLKAHISYILGKELRMWKYL